MGEVIGMVREAGPKERAKHQAAFLRALAEEFEKEPELAPDFIVLIQTDQTGADLLMDSSDATGGKLTPLILTGILHHGLVMSTVPGEPIMGEPVGE